MIPFRTSIPQIAVSLPLSAKIPRDFRNGILRYAKEHGPWNLHLLDGGDFSQRISDLRRFHCSGFIGYVTTDADVSIVRRLHVPCVLRWLDSGLLSPRIKRLCRQSATIETNSAAIGRFAARYYLKSKYSHFAYVGEAEKLEWSEIRKKAFSDELSVHGQSCHVYRGPVTRSFADEIPSLEEWLKSLPKPIGIFAVQDERARQIVDVCSLLGLNVPGDVGILGCDNDEDLCESSYPGISSIAVDAERAAYLGARLLDGLMNGTFARHRIVYGPVKVIERASTRLLSNRSDAIVERALDLIRTNVLNDITPDKLAEALSFSRRQLQRRFQASGHKTLLSEINAAKLRQAKVLLEDPAITVADLARKLGFSSASHFCRIYRDAFGHTPRQSPTK